MYEDHSLKVSLLIIADMDKLKDLGSYECIARNEKNTFETINTLNVSRILGMKLNKRLIESCNCVRQRES